MYPEPLRLFSKERPGAGHPRRCNTVEEINASLHHLKDVLYLTDPQKMPWFILWQKRDRPFQDLAHLLLRPAERATDGKCTIVPLRSL